MVVVVIREVEIDNIIPNTFNPNFISPEELEELRRNFSLEILRLNPIRVREAKYVKYSDLPEGKYEIIDGYHRWLVAREKGLKRIPVEIHNCSDEEAERTCVTSSLNRGTHNYLLLSVIFEKYYREGFTQEEIGRRFGYAQPMVAKILGIYSRVLPLLLKKLNYKNVLIFPGEYSNIIENYEILREVVKKTSKKINNKILAELATISNDSLRERVMDWLLTSNESIATKGKRISKIAAKCNEIERYTKARVKTEEEIQRVIDSIKEDLIEAPEGTLKSRIDLFLEKERDKEKEMSRAASFLDEISVSSSDDLNEEEVEEAEKRKKEKETEAPGVLEREKEGESRFESGGGETAQRKDSDTKTETSVPASSAPASMPAPRVIFADEDEGDERLTEVLEEVVEGRADGAVIRGDCFRILDLMASRGMKIDLVVTDPPYNISDKRKYIKKGEGLVKFKAGDWDSRDFLEYVAFVEDFLRKADEVLKHGGTIYIMLDRPTAGFVWKLMELGGLKGLHRAISEHFGIRCSFENEDSGGSNEFGITFKNIRIWKKTNPVPSFKDHRDMHNTEFILRGVKGDDYVYNREDKFLGDIDECPIATGRERELYPHPTAKPVELFERWIKRSSNVGDVVLDPFAGRGTAAVACLKTGRRFIIMEKEREHFATARRFISAWLRK
ncbi:MAG: hypothetical protein DRO01_04720 [Thermoproteota archaeon]|nr:MAG: hypothetical protein DRO01_04720 [Candidatus Korarchaeota archaeon]